MAEFARRRCVRRKPMQAFPWMAWSARVPGSGFADCLHANDNRMEQHYEWHGA